VSRHQLYADNTLTARSPRRRDRDLLALVLLNRPARNSTAWFS
jgi:hypothetical protein